MSTKNWFRKKPTVELEAADARRARLDAKLTQAQRNLLALYGLHYTVTEHGTLASAIAWKPGHESHRVLLALEALPSEWLMALMADELIGPPSIAGPISNVRGGPRRRRLAK